MTKKTYVILQKKLHELQALLDKAISLPLERRPNQIYSQDIQQRFIFLKNLLSAEIASNPRRPQHLTHIDRRLGVLQNAFNDWLTSETTAPDHLETASTCSCTESCLNDDGDEATNVDSGMDESEEEEEEVFFEDETPEGLELVGVGEEKEEVEEKKKVKIGEGNEMKKCLMLGSVGVLGGGFLVGAGLMGYVFILLFSGCFDVPQHHPILTPT